MSKKVSRKSTLLSRYTYDDLVEFVLNPEINPKTGRQLKVGSKFHDSLLNEAKRRNINKNNLFDENTMDIFNDYTDSPEDITKLILEFVGNTDIFYVIDNVGFSNVNITMCNSLNTAGKIMTKYAERYKYYFTHYTNDRRYEVCTLQAPATAIIDPLNLKKEQIIQKFIYTRKMTEMKMLNVPNISKISPTHNKSYVKNVNGVFHYFGSVEDVIEDLSNEIINCNNSLHYAIYYKNVKNSHSAEYIYTKINGRSLIHLNLHRYSMNVSLCDEFQPYETEIKKLMCQKYIDLSRLP